MIIGGARGIGGDLRDVVWGMVGVVERYCSSSSTRSLVWLVGFDMRPEGSEEEAKGKKCDRGFGREASMREGRREGGKKERSEERLRI